MPTHITVWSSICICLFYFLFMLTSGSRFLFVMKQTRHSTWGGILCSWKDKERKRRHLYLVLHLCQVLILLCKASPLLFLWILTCLLLFIYFLWLLTIGQFMLRKKLPIVFGWSTVKMLNYLKKIQWEGKMSFSSPSGDVLSGYRSPDEFMFCVSEKQKRR